MIYVTGDIHGEVFRVAEAVDRFKITAEDVIVILGDALEFFGKESIDPAEIAARAQEAYENLFSEPAADYLTNLVDAFQTTWESEEHILLCT